MRTLSIILLITINYNIKAQKLHCGGWNKCENEETLLANEKLIEVTNTRKKELKKIHIPYGKPRDFNNDLIMLIHEDFIIGYDTVLNIPLWVSYLLTSEWAKDTLFRKDCFRDDPRLRENSNQETCKIYSGSGYDRGHLAPRNDFNRSRTAQLNTFIFSNIVPQFPKHNRNTWKYLEHYINEKTKEKGLDSLIIVTGVIFDHDYDNKPDEKNRIPMISESRPLPVASDFYKIILEKNNDSTFKALAIIIPHENIKRKEYESLAYIESDCLTSIDIIEKKTGINFFYLLENYIEDVLEAKTSSTLW